MNNIQKAQIWVFLAIIIGMFLITFIGNAEWFGIWYQKQRFWGPIISAGSISLYVIMFTTVAEYLLAKDGYVLYIRSKG